MIVDITAVLTVIAAIVALFLGLPTVVAGGFISLFLFLTCCFDLAFWRKLGYISYAYSIILVGIVAICNYFTHKSPFLCSLGVLFMLALLTGAVVYREIVKKD